MQIGDKVNYYTTRTIADNRYGRTPREVIKHASGTLVRFDKAQDYAEVVPDGKRNTIVVPLSRITKYF